MIFGGFRSILQLLAKITQLSKGRATASLALFLQQQHILDPQAPVAANPHHRYGALLNQPVEVGAWPRARPALAFNTLLYG